MTAVADAVMLDATDNVCVAVRGLRAGETIAVGPRRITVASQTPAGHKLALAAIAAGQPVRKYGQQIGSARTPIAAGDWVHSHNLTAGQFDRDYAYSCAVPAPVPPNPGHTFQGYRRANGRAGTRNYVAVISSVNCSASVAKYIAARFDRQALAEFSHVDGVLPITHKSGCGMQYHGEDHAQLNRVLAGFAKHPNVGAYLLVGLGCETGQIADLLEAGGLVQLGAPPAESPPVLVLQELGGTQRTVEEGVRRVRELLQVANQARRQTLPASELVLGLNCGGSDGNSGITANPALGVASDLLVAAGGTVVLTETPEIYGAEHLLTRRARSRAVGEKLIERIRWWERYTSAFGAQIDNNPSPGNKAGGLTTIYEKSLGAVAKAGSTALEEVYLYGEPIRAQGLVFMDSPGFDPASVTGLVASGANLVAFTTGRGSCYGCKPTPSLKIATNTPMYQRMIDDMDVNAGEILHGQTIAEVGQEIFDRLLETASGRQTKSEAHGIGEEEFAPWSIGPTL